MTTDEKPAKGTQCCGRVRRAVGYLRGRACGKQAKAIRDGEPYCNIHDPVKIEERRKKRLERDMEEYEVWKQKKDAAEAARAERDRRAACYDDLLAALEKLAPHIPDAVTACHGNKCRQPFCEDCSGEDEAQKAIEAALEAHLQAIAAIAKAKGE